jgi:hypothetical protein
MKAFLRRGKQQQESEEKNQFCLVRRRDMLDAHSYGTGQDSGDGVVSPYSRPPEHDLLQRLRTAPLNGLEPPGPSDAPGTGEHSWCVTSPQ